MKNTQVPGPAVQLLKFGFAVKRPLCQIVDTLSGIDESNVRSLTRFLEACRDARYGGFKLLDDMFEASLVLWGLRQQDR